MKITAATVAKHIKARYGYSVKLSARGGVVRFASSDPRIADTLDDAPAVYVPRVSDLTLDRWLAEFRDAANLPE